METKCPICGKKVQLSLKKGKDTDSAGAEFPFCSHRCKLIDLGAWLNAEYRIPINRNEPCEEQNENTGHATENS